MRIVLIAQNLIEYTIQLANSLSKTQEVRILLWENLAENYLELLNTDINVEFLFKPKTRSHKNLFLIFKTVKIVKSLKPDVIHIQNPYFWMCFGFPFLRKYPTVVTIHEIEPHSGSEKLRSKLTYKLFIKSADKIIVHCNKLKEKIIKDYKLYQENVFAIPHGDFSYFTNITHKKFDEEEKWILFFGRIKKYKGLEYLIKAQPAITKEIPDTKIVIAGAGEYLTEIKSKINKNDTFILYDQYISNEMVGELFQKASIVVLPYSKGWHQPGVLSIAGAFKKPVVATEVGCIPEVVEDGKTGYVVPPKNTEKLAEAIIRLLKNKDERTRMGENAYKKTKDELSWDKIAEKTIRVYKESILSKK